MTGTVIKRSGRVNSLGPLCRPCPGVWGCLIQEVLLDPFTVREGSSHDLETSHFTMSWIQL